MEDERINEIVVAFAGKFVKMALAFAWRRLQGVFKSWRDWWASRRVEGVPKGAVLSSGLASPAIMIVVITVVVSAPS